jgi:hypothetical protein
MGGSAASDGACGPIVPGSSARDSLATGRWRWSTRQDETASCCAVVWRRELDEGQGVLMVGTAGSLPRGRRRRDEVPEVPDPGGLTDVERRAQSVLKEMVDRDGGRFDSGPRVSVDRLDVFADLFDEWGRNHGDHDGEGILFSGRPGLWHALDDLYPLQDPNRWDQLRQAVTADLEDRHWTRVSPPRGSAFRIRDSVEPANPPRGDGRIRALGRRSNRGREPRADSA